MKPYFVILAVLFCFAPMAQAQVFINQAALNQLAGIPPANITAPPQIRQSPRKIAYRPALRHRLAMRRAASHLASSRIVPPPTLPPKPAPQVQQAVAEPVIPLAPKPASPPNTAIAFAAGASDLPAGIAAQLKPFCAHPAPTGPITIDAYAAADPTDPSAAPRLSMTRAFALRDALSACGIPAASIIPRADGAASKTPDIAVISAP